MKVKVGLVTGVAMAFGLVGVFSTRSEASTPDTVLAKVRDAASQAKTPVKASTWQVIPDGKTSGTLKWQRLSVKPTKGTVKSWRLVLDRGQYKDVKFGKEPYTLILEEKGTGRAFSIVRYDRKSYKPTEWVLVKPGGKK